MKLKIGDKIIPKKEHWLAYGFDPYYVAYFEVIRKSNGWYFAKPVFKSEEKRQEFLEYVKNSVSKWMSTGIPVFVNVKITYEIGNIWFLESDVDDFEIVEEARM